MSKIQFTTDHQTLGQAALDALLAGVPLTITLPSGWERPRNFPLPVSKVQGNEQPYRPMAILEYIVEQKNGEKTGERMRQMHAAQEDDEL